MNAETAGHVGIQKLKQLNMVNIEMFRHPKYYKELRKLRNKLDQAISKEPATAVEFKRSPGPGPKQQASSSKLQASSAKLIKQQAASIKPRG